MKKIAIVFLSLIIGGFSVLPISGEQRNKVKYEKKYTDPVLKEMEEARANEQRVQDDETAAIRKRQEEQTSKDKASEQVLQSDMTGVFPPPSPEAFRRVFHLTFGDGA